MASFDRNGRDNMIHSYSEVEPDVFFLTTQYERGNDPRKRLLLYFRENCLYFEEHRHVTCH